MAIPYKSPGVYVVEVPSPARPIAGVGTSTPAFIGIIPDVTARVADAGGGKPKFVVFDFSASPKRAAANTPYFVSSWTQFVGLFGDFLGDTAETSRRDRHRHDDRRTGDGRRGHTRSADEALRVPARSRGDPRRPVGR